MLLLSDKYGFMFTMKVMVLISLILEVDFVHQLGSI